MLVSLATIFLVAALVGGATFALFTDTSTNANNTFAAGTVIVGLTDASFVTDNFNIDNIAPGDEISGSFTITNDGSLDQWYQIIPNIDGDLFAGETPATVTFDDYTAEDWVELASGESVVVSFVVQLPFEADNSYQEAGGTLSFTVNAQQVRNNPDKVATEFFVSPVK